MPKSKRHTITTFPRFAKRSGLSLEAIVHWMYKKSLTAPILVFGRDGLPRIDETEFHEAFGVLPQRRRRSIEKRA